MHILCSGLFASIFFKRSFASFVTIGSFGISSAFSIIVLAISSLDLPQGLLLTNPITFKRKSSKQHLIKHDSDCPNIQSWTRLCILTRMKLEISLSKLPQEAYRTMFRSQFFLLRHLCKYQLSQNLRLSIDPCFHFQKEHFLISNLYG
jgi:hypothetical protein